MEISQVCSTNIFFRICRLQPIYDIYIGIQIYKLKLDLNIAALRIDCRNIPWSQCLIKFWFDQVVESPQAQQLWCKLHNGFSFWATFISPLWMPSSTMAFHFEQLSFSPYECPGLCRHRPGHSHIQQQFIYV